VTAVAESWQEALFSDLLQGIRVRRCVYFQPTFGAPWGLALEGVVTHFHYVLGGTGWVQVGGASEAIPVGTGDLVVVPRGRPHVMYDAPGTRPVNFFEIVNTHGIDSSGALRAGGSGALTRFLCGGFQLENGAASVLLAVLPPVLLIRGHGDGASHWLPAAANQLLEELQSGKPYRDPVVTRLVDVFFMQAVRAYLNDNADHVETGWLAALRDKRIGQALALMHSQPDERWTVASLASRLAISRSAFAERFSRILGEPPHRYLARFRINVASERLLATDDKISSIAAAAGYRSLPAFSKAFKQELGASPIEYRRMGRSRRKVHAPGTSP